MPTTITIKSDGREITIPANPRGVREGACEDVIFGVQLDISCPICAEISLWTDGRFRYLATRYDNAHNTYAHILPHENRQKTPTEAQKKAIAEWYGGLSDPLNLGTKPGKTILEWAFPGMSAREISEKYLGNRTIYVNA